MATIVENLRRWPPVTRWALGVALVVAAILLIYLAASSRTDAGLASDAAEAADGAGAPEAPNAEAVLNEILFMPPAGESEFIELKALEDDTAFGGWTIANEKNQTYALPSTTPRVHAGEFLLIVFDGADVVAGQTLHADRKAFLNPAKGFVQLADATGSVVDRVAWGRGQPDGVNLGRGGSVDDPAAGTTIGRFPLSVKSAAFLEWLTFEGDQVTPGAANPNPAVAVLMPLDGAYFAQPSIKLDWYPVAGATRYRVRIASDAQFGHVVEDHGVEAPSFTTPALQPGEYFWRVQAVFADDSVAAPSPSSSFTISTTEWPTGSPTGAPQASRSFFPRAYAADTIPPLREGVLAVPMIYQHKDTAMLQLESMNATGPHAWDVVHAGLDPDDPSDSMNCALASIAMVNHVANGTISQDRLGYELFKDTWPDDPAWDLNYGRGLYVDEITNVLTFAFNGATATLHTPTTADAFWNTVTTEIDAGRALVARVPGHAIVISGYYQFAQTGPNARFVTINDPWRGRYLVSVSQMGTRLTHYWALADASHPRNDEAEIALDSDGDGIVDFDEMNRFKTQPANRDSDADGIDDKTEIYATVYDPAHGHARWRWVGHGRDFDDDLKFMERDADSDAGGCKDGQEDANANGKRDAGETYNFDKRDDRCPPPPLGGRVHIAYAYAQFGMCTGNVTIDTRFQLIPDVVPGTQNLVSTYHANEMTYDISTGACADRPGDHLTYTFDEGFHLAGTMPLTADNLGHAAFWPTWPRFSMHLPFQLTEIGAANSLKGSYTGNGGGPWPADTYAVFNPLTIQSDPAYCTDPSDAMYARPEVLEFCTEPTPCANVASAPIACLSEPQRYYVLPFTKSFQWAPANEPGHKYQIGNVGVTVEICEGCGEDFL